MFNKLRGLPPIIESKLAFPLYGIIGGVVLMVFGLIGRARARGRRNLPCNQASPHAAAGRQVIMGKAHSPSQLNSPVSNTACVFYLEKTQALKYARYGQNGRQEYRDGRLVEAFGGFFVRYGMRTAFVVPFSGSADLNKPETTKGFVDGIQKFEQIILEGEDVTIIGTPRPLGEFMAYLRRDAGISLPSDSIADLTRMEKDPGYSGMPCFYADGLESVTDQPYNDYLARTASSGLAYVLAGAVITAASAAALVYFNGR